MPRQVLDAVDILPGKKGWTCIVQVLERHPILHKKLKYFPFQKKYRNFLLTDMKGTKVKAVMFDGDIGFFERYLHPFKRYKISNASVTIPEERFQSRDYKYNWIITSKCPVEPIIDDKPYTIPCSFDVCKFSDLHKFAETDTQIAIRGLVVHQFPDVDITNLKSTKDYVVVNEEEIPIVLRLWKDLLEAYDPHINTLNKEPITIIATNLEVNTFHGLSLATRNETYILQDPPLPAHLTMKNWYAQNKEKVANWVKHRAYEDSSRFFLPPKQEDILDLPSAYKAFENVKTCWIKAKVKLSVTRIALFYVVCKNCQMTVDAGFDWSVECSGCSVLSPMEARLQLPVTLFDGDTTMRSMIKTPDAEKLCPFTAVEAKEKEEQGLSIMNDVSIAMDNTEVLCFVKYYDKPIGAELVRRYVILKTYIPDEIKSFNVQTSPPSSSTVNLGSNNPGTLSDHAPMQLRSPNQPSKLDAQLFTPTIKHALEQAGQHSTAIETSTSQPCVAKRHISFGTITAEDIEGLSDETLDATVNLGVETPKKKNKASNKHG